MSNTKVKWCVCVVWCFVVVCVVVGWFEQQAPPTETTTEFTYYTSRELGILMQSVIDTERAKGVVYE